MVEFTHRISGMLTSRNDVINNIPTVAAYSYKMENITKYSSARGKNEPHDQARNNEIHHRMYASERVAVLTLALVARHVNSFVHQRKGT